MQRAFQPQPNSLPVLCRREYPFGGKDGDIVRTLRMNYREKCAFGFMFCGKMLFFAKKTLNH